jgi:hypothetical protein
MQGPTERELRERALDERRLGRDDRPRSLHDRTDEVNSTIDKLDALLGQLTDRLEPVLGPGHPEPGSVRLPESTDASSWLAEYLDSTQRRLNDTVRGVQRLIGRVEL